MGCTDCKKNKEKIFKPEINTSANNGVLKNTLEYVLKFLLFLLLTIILLPILILLFIISLFKIVVLSKPLNILPLVYYIARKIFRNKKEENETEEEEDIDYSEYELENPEEIIVVK